MTLEYLDTNTPGPLTEADLAQAEAALGAPLPADYRAFLLDNNGCEFLEAVAFPIAGGDDESVLEELFGIGPEDNPGSVFGALAALAGRLPAGVLPIAEDPGGNVVCLVLSGDARGAVDFWDHETGDRVRLASSFGAFLDLLTPVDEDDECPVDVDAVVQAAEQGVPLNGALVTAVRVRDAEALAYLVGRGADVNARCDSPLGETALTEAAAAGEAEMVRDLLRLGADPNIANGQGHTALAWAVQMGDLGMAQDLLRAGADPNVETPYGPPLALAAGRSTVAMLELLMAHGASLEVADQLAGLPALIFAISGRKTENVAFLLAHGCDPRAKSSEGTPLQYARKQKAREIVALLEQATAAR